MCITKCPQQLSSSFAQGDLYSCFLVMIYSNNQVTIILLHIISIYIQVIYTKLLQKERLREVFQNPDDDYVIYLKCYL